MTIQTTQEQLAFRPGLIGRVASFFLASAPRPVPEIALAGAIGYLAGLCGNAFNINRAGLNQYILFLAATGIGKDIVADGSAALTDAIWYSKNHEPFPHSGAELVSASGTIKLMARNPCNFTIVGEFGKKLKGMTDPRNSVLYPLNRVPLQMYSKSGAKGVFDPMAYSDADKVTKRIIRPSLTLIGESVPEGFYASLDEGLILDGLLSRFMIWEVKGKRTYFNENAKNVVPDAALVADLQSFISQCNVIRATPPGVFEVPLEKQAEALFREYDVWTTDEINGSQAEIARQLWNRAHLKAMKLAALEAVCENWINPVVTHAQAKWATDLIAGQTNNLISRFSNGDVGEEVGNQSKQRNHITRLVNEFLSRPFDKATAYGQSEAMHKMRIVTHSYLQKRVFTLPAFKPKPTQALRDIIETFTNAHELQEVPVQQMAQDCHTRAKAYKVIKPKLFDLPYFFDD